MAIQSRIPADQYFAIDALNISRLKEIKRSPQHYKYRLANPAASKALTLGNAAHTAILEPERFESDYAVWTNRTESGAMSPRRGKVWDEFQAQHVARTILTADESDTAKNMQAAVRSCPAAMKYLQAGDPEVTMEWVLDGRPCKGRADWLTTVDGMAHIVGLKSARDCRLFAFGAQAAKLGYHWQWAWYHDGYYSITDNGPRMVEIIVESVQPHAVAVYVITNDILDQGREEYLEHMQILAECERTGLWPGPMPDEQDLSLPTWAYTQGDDIADLDLETGD